MRTGDDRDATAAPRPTTARRRDAQVHQVFTFIMFAVIAGVVLLLGYTFIDNLLGKACQTEKIRFMNTLEKDLRSYASHGSFHKPGLQAPCEAERLCFVDATNYDDQDGDGIYEDNAGFSNPNRVIADAVRHPESPPKNIFLVYDDGTTEPLGWGEKVALTEPDEELCINRTSGTFIVGFEGRGRTVLLTDETRED